MINFATLQGLSIPEGVVTQITDASGMVLWSAVKEEPFVYLRPSADISFTGAKYPEDLAYGYLAISEEVADGYTTYIGGSASGVGGSLTSVEGTFLLSASIPPTIKKVTSGEFGIAYIIDGTDEVSTEEPSGLKAKVTVSGVEYTLIVNESAFNGLKTVTIPSGLIDNINGYINANGVFPEITLYLFAKSRITTDGTEKKTVNAKIDQVYLALEYER